jgi:hypothetical protein
MTVIFPSLYILLAYRTQLCPTPTNLHMLHKLIKNYHCVTELAGFGQFLTLMFGHFVGRGSHSAMLALFGLVSRCFMFNFVGLFEEFAA